MRSRVRLWSVIGVVAAVSLAVTMWQFAPWWRERAMRTTPRPLNVLLVTLDTTRADRLGAFGDARAETPNLDALAAGGTRFTQAYSHVPLTLPSHVSMMTGVIPTRHGIRDNGAVAPGDLTVLAERFRGAGYRTAAFVSAFVLDHRFGLARGFDQYVDDVPGATAEQAGDPSERSVRAEATVDRALDWLKRTGNAPRFMWVHLYDPHAPYDPPEPFASRHRDAPYAGEIAYMDAQIGRLIKTLEASRAKPWLVVAIGDHGEGLGDHDEVTHGYFVYSNTQRVPLIVSLPGHVPSGRVVDDVVRAVDVAPTVLDLAGLSPLPDVDGRSLVPLIAGAATGDVGPAYLESFQPRLWWGAQELLALRTGRWLFIEAPRPELYDVTADAAERVNLAASHPRELETLTTLLKDYARPGAATAARAKLDSAAEARLRSLGYLGAGQIDPKAAAGTLPDAKDNSPLLASVSRGQELASKGRLDEALVQFRAALQKNPRSIAAQLRIAETLLALRRYDEAFTAYGDVASTGQSNEDAYVGMAKARAGQGRAKDAIAVARAGLDVTPHSATLNVLVGDWLLAQGNVAEAEQSYQRALVIAPDDELAHGGLIVVFGKLGRSKDAIDVMLRLAENSPHSVQARATSEALERWADEQLGRGAPAAARRGYEAALKTGRESPELYLNLGLATLRATKGDANAILDVVDRGLGRFPESADLFYRKGRILEQIGRTSDAHQAFARAVTLSPGHVEARSALERYASPSTNRK